MKTTNALPGMNPYLECRWSDTHTRLITYIGDALSEQLPLELTVVAEESVSIDAPHEMSISLRADVAVVENGDIRVPQTILSATDQPSTLTIAEPEILRLPGTHRWLEIRDTHNRLITVIEILSPSNKTRSGAEQFSHRQDCLIRDGVNVLDIDLLRSGVRALPAAFTSLLQYPESETTYLLVAGLANRPEERQVYYCPLKQPLPVIAVPLRESDSDVPLDLQPLVDRSYVKGRYWQIAQRRLPDPPLFPDEMIWMDELRAEAGLIDPV